MAKLSRKLGATSQILQVFIRDSSSTTGAGLTGLAFSTGSLTAYYHRDTDTTATAISLVTMTVGTFTSSGFKEVDAGNLPGVYQLCPPNAAFASGATSVFIMLKGAANMAPLPIEIDLDAQVDVTSILGTASAGAAGYVGLDWSAINAPTTAQGLTGTTISASQVVASVTGAAGSVTGAVGSVTGNVGGNVVGSVGSVSGNVGGNVVGSVASVTARVTANTDQLAGQTVTAAAGVTFPTSVASPTNITAGTITNATNVTNLTNAPTVGDFTATMKTSLNAATPASTGSVTGDVSGKVLGGGAGTITGTGVRAVDSSGNAIAPASTALSTAQWTNTLATNLGTTNTTVATNLDATVSSRAPAATALSTVVWTAPPSGFLAATFPAGTIVNNTTTPSWYTAPGTAPTTAQIATAVWQDTTAGDFTTAGSIGKSLFTSGNVPGAASGLALVGSNMGAVTSVSGNVGGSVGSISGVTFPTNFGTLSIDGSGLVTFANTSIATVANLTNAPTNGDFTATMKTSLSAATPALSAAGNNAVADATLARNIAGGSSTGRTVYQALAVLRNKVDAAGTPGSLLVYAIDDTTILWSGTLTSSAGADPIVTLDPG